MVHFIRADKCPKPWKVSPREWALIEANPDAGIVDFKTLDPRSLSKGRKSKKCDIMPYRVWRALQVYSS